MQYVVSRHNCKPNLCVTLEYAVVDFLVILYDCLVFFIVQSSRDGNCAEISWL